MSHRRVRALAVSALLGLGAITLAPAASAPEPAAPGERPPAVAGKFYPADPTRLRAAVEAYLADALPPPAGAPVRPLALLAPHAGLLFSGPIAADAYRQATGFEVEVVVVLGTNHTVPAFPGVSVQQATAYRTPLGRIEADTALARQLLALGGEDGLVRFDPAAHTSEHSEEVQLPFVQVVFPHARVVTAVVGSSDAHRAARFGELLARALAGRRALVVASSDLSHYPAADAAVEADTRALAAIATLDPAEASRELARIERSGGPALVTAACGQGAILAAMAAARGMGATRGRVVSYANSGDTVAGERDRVVGYGAVVFDAGPPLPRENEAKPAASVTTTAPAKSEAELSPADRQTLLALARRTVERWFATGTLPLPRPEGAVLRRNQGAFVTWKQHGELRGCIGHMAEDTPLALTVARMAISAALEDHRFPPVRPDELAGLELEISVLSPFTPIPGPGAIVVGRDGVMLDLDGHRAVFLPQVAPEQGWERDEMLGHLCAKAGLASNCWRQGAKLSTFRAEVFGEKGPG
ncbi:MAG: AmmeMemoRadiSam system protein B [Holophagales bacterium]|nr:MAG: AmmeMemoRadiSam system protein B [Holophagales bacterium]